ncbi:hypothetical protein SAMN04487944_106100 [Gracilibacillus ureilyticus]|uniref:Uncharacterized protein n=1 Tax=Gracilibacillus ureilyticus TaxID=531814 RepID=A0A1H9QAA3_9BACI|nr:hypothetical protein SAMN04487944_106100 [Gracilibacillus ureilyticus]
MLSAILTLQPATSLSPKGTSAYEELIYLLLLKKIKNSSLSYNHWRVLFQRRPIAESPMGTGRAEDPLGEAGFFNKLAEAVPMESEAIGRSGSIAH